MTKPNRGRVEKPEPSRRVVVARGAGSGPPCPDEHGPMYDWSLGKWYCPHSDHGGNGQFFAGDMTPLRRTDLTHKSREVGDATLQG